MVPSISVLSHLVPSKIATFPKVEALFVNIILAWFDTVGKPIPLFAEVLSVSRTIYNQFTANTLTSLNTSSGSITFSMGSFELHTDRMPRLGFILLCKENWRCLKFYVLMDFLTWICHGGNRGDTSPDKKMWFGRTVNLKLTSNISSSLEIEMGIQES